MPLLSEVQRQFAAAVWDPDLDPPPGVVGPDLRPAPRRFAVYRNNVVASLSAAVTKTFPAIVRIVGADFFKLMARTYVLSHPPTSPVLIHYGGDFPEFVAGFEPAASLTYLADVARIEWAWLQAYHAADAEPMNSAALSAISEADLPRVRFDMHASVRMVSSPYPALTIWKMNVGDGKITPVDSSVAEDALIIRPESEVQVRSIPLGSGAFVAALAAGETLAAASERGFSADAGFDLAGSIAGLVDAGAFTGVRL